jgi:hypothetical protein
MPSIEINRQKSGPKVQNLKVNDLNAINSLIFESIIDFKF